MTDHVINIFEIKFYGASFALTKADAQSLREKMVAFKELTQTPKQLFRSLITTFGLTPNEHSIGLIDHVLTLDDLFET